MHARNETNSGSVPGSCDCHAHVCGHESRYPYAPERLYTPHDAPPADFRAMLDRLGIERGVLVQPSIYGIDNRRMLDALKEDPKRLRGVAVLPESIPSGEVERLHRQGVRGVRCNIVDRKEGKGVLPLEELKKLARTVKPFGWHVEFLMHVDEFPDLDRQLADFPVDVVFGHLGYVNTRKSIEEKGFQALLRLMKDGKAWVKLTAPYRLTMSALPYPDTDVFANALVDAAPGRLLWGSDWPHVFIKTAMPEDRKLLQIFEKWVPDENLRRRILVDHPAALYGFS
jgi:predicted TIM-barrel fold metal-dependent hydrolase